MTSIQKLKTYETKCLNCIFYRKGFYLSITGQMVTHFEKNRNHTVILIRDGTEIVRTTPDTIVEAGEKPPF